MLDQSIEYGVNMSKLIDDVNSHSEKERMSMKIKLSEILQDTKTVAISGHIRPDGDCVGSCIGLYLYIQQEFPDVQPTVYLGRDP